MLDISARLWTTRGSPNLHSSADIANAWVCVPARAPCHAESGYKQQAMLLNLRRTSTLKPTPCSSSRFTASSRSRRPCTSDATLSRPTDLHARCSRGRDRVTPTGLPSPTARKDQQDRGPDAANRPGGGSAASRHHAHDRLHRLHGRERPSLGDASGDDPHRRGLRTGSCGG